MKSLVSWMLAAQTRRQAFARGCVIGLAILGAMTMLSRYAPIMAQQTGLTVTLTFTADELTALRSAATRAMENRLKALPESEVSIGTISDDMVQAFVRERCMRDIAEVIRREVEESERDTIDTLKSMTLAEREKARAAIAAIKAKK